MRILSSLIIATWALAWLTASRVEAQPDPNIKAKLPDCYVLSAGVNNFRNATKLKGCLNDARNATAAFKAQEGVMFRRVEHENLLAESATRGNILHAWLTFSKRGTAGDYMVLFLAGHGGLDKSDQSWYYTPFDYNSNNAFETALTDEQILDAGDVLVKQKKKVVIIIDACHSGQVQKSAKLYFDRYKVGQDGGMILMLACEAKQVCTSAGEDGAFSKTFAEVMTSHGDLNNDGRITLGEVGAFCSRRTNEILAQVKNTNKQNNIVVWSSSFSKDTPFAAAKTIPQVANRFKAPRLPRDFGDATWDVTALEKRFTIVRCDLDAESNRFVFVLDLKEDINLPLNYQLSHLDLGGVTIHTSSASAFPMTGKQGGRMRLTVNNTLVNVNRETWAEAVKLKFVAK